MDTLEAWIEALPSNAARLRVRAGYKRDPRTVDTVKLDGERDACVLADRVYDLADEKATGWTHLRVDALGDVDGDGRRRAVQIDTWSETGEAAAAPSGQDQAIGALTRALVQSQTEMRRAVGALSTALAESRRMEREAVADAIQSRVEHLETALQVERMVGALEGAGGGGDDAVRKELGPILRKLGDALFGGGTPTVDDVRAWQAKDPEGFAEWLRKAAEDDKVREAFMGAFSRRDASTA